MSVLTVSRPYHPPGVGPSRILLYLFVLFAVLLVEHGLGGLVSRVAAV